MLWDKTGTEQFNPLSRDFLHNRRIVHEPPASEGHQVAEFPRIHAKLVLIFAAQHAHQKTIFRKSAAKILHRAKIRFADRVTGKSESGIRSEEHTSELQSHHD